MEAREQVRIIDPTELKGEDALILKNFLDQERRQGNSVFFANLKEGTLPYVAEFKDQTTGEQKKVQFHLTHDIAYSAKHLPTGDVENRYLILKMHPEKEQLVGQGGLGTVVKVLGVLREKGNTIHYTTTTKPFVAKLQKHHEFMPVELAIRESNLLKASKVHKPKAPIIQSISPQLGSTLSIIVMREFKGTSLDLFLESDAFKQLSTDKKIQLSINILRAVQQLSDQNIIHNDIKPQNIIIDTDTLEANIIDFGSARLKNEKIAIQQVTSVYAPLEGLLDEKNSVSARDQSSDLYSAILSIQEIWGAPQRKGEFSADFITEAKKETQEFIRELSKGNKLEKLGDDAKKLINIFKKATSLKQNDRGTIEEAINGLEEIKLKRKLNKVTGEASETIKKANLIALYCINDLRKITQSKTGNVDNLRKTLLNSIEKLDDNPRSLKEFIDVINISTLKPLANEAQLTKKLMVYHLNSIIEAFKGYDKNFYRMLNEANLNAILLVSALRSNPLLGKNEEFNKHLSDWTALIKEALYLHYKPLKRQFNLDEINELNNRFKYEYPLLQKRKNDLLVQFDNLVKTIDKNLESANLKPISMLKKPMEEFPLEALPTFINDTVSKRYGADIANLLRLNVLNKFIFDETVHIDENKKAYAKEIIRDIFKSIPFDPQHFYLEQSSQLGKFILQYFTPSEIPNLLQLDSFPKNLRNESFMTGINFLRFNIIDQLSLNENLSNRVKKEIIGKIALTLLNETKEVTKELSFLSQLVEKLGSLDYDFLRRVEVSFTNSPILTRSPISDNVWLNILDNVQHKAYQIALNLKSITPEQDKLITKLLEKKSGNSLAQAYQDKKDKKEIKVIGEEVNKKLEI